MKATPPHKVYVVVDRHGLIVDTYTRPPTWLDRTEQVFEYDVGRKVSLTPSRHRTTPGRKK